MPLDLWLAFVAASTLLVLLPGPTVLLVVGTALGRGRSAGLAAVPGVMLGDFVAMTASFVGLGAILAASATAFLVMKWIGAAYLVILGLRMWWTAPMRIDAPVETASHKRIGFQAFVVTALNPKGLAFFIAFVPQFLDHTQPLLPQLVVAEATFIALAGLNTTAYALLASKARQAVARPGTQKLLNRAGGSALLGAGVMTAMVQRTG